MAHNNNVTAGDNICLTAYSVSAGACKTPKIAQQGLEAFLKSTSPRPIEGADVISPAGIGWSWLSLAAQRVVFPSQEAGIAGTPRFAFKWRSQGNLSRWAAWNWLHSLREDEMSWPRPWAPHPSVLDLD